jgi:hypothetical protein
VQAQAAPNEAGATPVQEEAAKMASVSSISSEELTFQGTIGH